MPERGGRGVGSLSSGRLKGVAADHLEVALDLGERFFEDHPGHQHAHLPEVGRDGRQAVEDDLVDRRLVVGDDADVAAHAEVQFARPAHQLDQSQVVLAVEDQVNLLLADDFGGDLRVELYGDVIVTAEPLHGFAHRGVIEARGQRHDVEPGTGFELFEPVPQPFVSVIGEILVDGAVVTRKLFHPVIDQNELSVGDTREYLQHPFLRSGVEWEVGRDDIVVEQVEILFDVVFQQFDVLIVEPDGDLGRVTDLPGERVKKHLLIVAQLVEQHEDAHFCRDLCGRNIKSLALSGVDESLVSKYGVGLFDGLLRDVKHGREFVHRRQQASFGILAAAHQCFHLPHDLFVNWDLAFMIYFNRFRHVLSLKNEIIVGLFIFLRIFAPHHTTLIGIKTTPHNFYIVVLQIYKKKR